MNQLRSPYSQPKEFYTNQNRRGQTTIQSSFDRMKGIGEVGDLGGRMGALERASMRLGEAASQRRQEEMEKEYGLKGGLMSQEYGLKGGLMSQEYGLKGGLLGQEYGYRGAMMEREYELKEPELNIAAFSALASARRRR